MKRKKPVIADDRPVIVDRALAAKIEFMEREIARLTAMVESPDDWMRTRLIVKNSQGLVSEPNLTDARLRGRLKRWRKIAGRYEYSESEVRKIWPGDWPKPRRDLANP